ncbi:MAG: proline--tRNA ligase [bacterium]|nr:proline--tRNA ligase [bacterium]
MIRSKSFIPTLKEAPNDAVTISHQLMLRSGMIRQLSAGVYSFLPLGWKSTKKVIEIIRQEMDRIGAQEFFLPSLNPIEIWDETGRNKNFGDDMMRVTDRKGRLYALAPTHEEIICHLARSEVRSWRDLPQIWYQIQTKYRDEPRPRSGLLRVRQFLMKDSYSLGLTEDDLDQSYLAHREAYKKIFERCGIDYFIVGASSGLMGGSQSEEFMAVSSAGEDRIVRCPTSNYAANIEIAKSIPPKVTDEPSVEEIYEIPTPTQRTIEEVSAFLGIPQYRCIKTLVYDTESGKTIVALLRGDDDLVEAKLQSAVGEPIKATDPEQVPKLFHGADVGFLGPLKIDLPIYADLRLQNATNMVSGANKNGYHIGGIDVGRQFQPSKFVDLREVRAGELSIDTHSPLEIVTAIELGHIFKLGTKYSVSMGATVLNQDGKEVPIIMGSYGIGVGRILVAAIEQNHDEVGIQWNNILAPYIATIIPVHPSDTEINQIAFSLYNKLKEKNIETVLDDRDVRAGVKFKDADLIGYPFSVIIGEKAKSEDKIELKVRKDGSRLMLSSGELVCFLESLTNNVI